MSIIKAKTNDREIEFITMPEITSGDENLSIITVILDPSWQIRDAEFYMNFYTSDDSESILKRTDTHSNICICAVPNKMFEKPGCFHFGIFASAPDGTIKTSKIAEYRILQGINTLGTGKDTLSAAAVKSKFIRLINANSAGVMLSEEMDFDNEIDPTYTNYMERINVISSDYRALLNGLYNIIKDYIDPEVENIDDFGLASLIYMYLLSDYVQNSVSRFSYDSVSEDLNTSNDMLDQLTSELEQKNTIIENIKTIFETLYSGDDTNSNT